MNTKLALSAVVGLPIAVYLFTGALSHADVRAERGTLNAETPLPDLTDNQREFLMRVARRTIRDQALSRRRYEPGYVPQALQRVRLEVVVRLRDRGFLLAHGSAGPAPLAEGVRDASLTAVQAILSADPSATDVLANPLVEIEIVGPEEPIPFEGNWTEPRAVDPYIEPGVHGLRLAGAEAKHRFCPSELITSDVPLSDALVAIAKKTHRDPSDVANTKLMRFRTAHFYQASSGEPVIPLHRGLTILFPEEVSRRGLDEVIEHLAEYMAYRQQASGLFAYQYEPGRNRYSDDDSLVRQIGAALAMCVHARRSGRSASRAACELAIRYHLRGLRALPGVENATFIATADQANKLGVTALLCLALAEHPEPDQYAATRARLVNGMLALQRESGLFVTAFPPAIGLESQDYFPGEALLAMASHYAHAPSGTVLDAFDRAIRFYRGYFRDRPSPAFVPWQVQAYARIVEHSKRRDYIEFVFELTDWLTQKQLTAANCEWPEMWGGIAAYQEGRAGIATAAYLEAFADALVLARRQGDEARVLRYERVVRSAVRFVVQLQVRPEEAYFVRSPRDAIWGMRASPALNLLRIDHCQHALVGLIKAREVLYPDEP